MKNLTTILILGLLVLSCKPNKEISKTTQSDETVTESTNSFFDICECRNSKGVTIEEHGKIMSENNKISIEEYAQSIPSLMEDQENWIFKEFFYDEVFLTNIESLLKDNLMGNDENPENTENMMNEAMEKYPICWQVFPYMLSLAKRN